MRYLIAMLSVLGSLLVATSTTVAQPAKSPPSWIWHAEGDPRVEAPSGSRFFRKIVTLDKAPDSAKLEITADNHFIVWINGQKVGAGDEWATLFSFDVAKLLKAGKNLVAVEGINDDGPAGLVVRIRGKADGKAFDVVSDGSWKSSDKLRTGWLTGDDIDSKWPAAMVLGAYGKTPPWLGGGGGGRPVSSNPKERFTIPDGFVMEKVVPANATWDGMPAGQHVSFVNCCFDAKGRLLLSQEGGPILMVVDPKAKEPTTKLSVYCDLVKNCHGMTWMDDSLFLVGDGPEKAGLYRCTEKDDRIVSVKLLHKFNGGMGEHGPHAVFPGPDGMLYFCVGNHSTAQLGEAAAKFGNPKQIAPNSPLVRWPTGGHGPDQNKLDSTEDVLLPRLNDANGHAANILAPGGTIWRCDLDGKNMALVSAGYRNQFDAAFNPHGELFTFDSDMEWDIGLPWYRPVRMLHAPMGSDFGWRTGAANQMAYLFDTLPALHDTGRGSPVGVECYDSFEFDKKYRGAILCADWSIGILYAVIPEIKGGTYSATVEKLVEGRPMNITDVAVGPDGAAYLSLGGRGGAGEVYRLRAHEVKRLSLGDNFSELLLRMGQPLAGYRHAEIEKLFREGGASLVSQLHEASRAKSSDPLLRIRALDFLQRYTKDGVSTARLAELLKDDDVAVRAHAVQMLGQRTAADVSEPLHMALKDGHPFVQRAACEALIRTGIEPSLDELRPLLGNPDRFLRFAARSVLERIDSKKWAGRLEDPEKLGLHAGLDMIVTLCRTNQAAPHAEAIFEFLKQHAQPSADADMLDVVRTMQLALCHTTERPASVKAIGVAWVPMFPHPDWRISRELAVTLADLEKERIVDDFHERLLGEMIKEKTDREQQIHYAYCLRVAQRGWSEKDKIKLIAWYDSTKSWSGGNSFRGFLQNIIKDLLPVFDADDRKEVLAEAGQHEGFALLVLQSSTKDMKPAELADLYAAIKPTSAKSREIKDQIVAALGSNPKGAEAVRAIGDSDPDAAEAVARVLASRPGKENWPYLVRGLDAKSPVVIADVVRVLGKSTEKPKLSTPPLPDEAKPFRSLIVASGRLPEKDRGAVAKLLRRWGGKNFALEDDDWKGEITGWARWYGQTFPKEPALPNTAALTSTSKWNSAELLAYLNSAKDGDVVRGKVLFEKANCIKCHKFGPVGEGIGPDLTTMKARFKKADILESILEPSKVVSDQYRGTLFVTKAGKTISGLAALQGDTYTVLQSDGTKIALPKSDIDQQVASTISPMPERLIDELTREEIRDLFAFLESEVSAGKN